MRLLLDTHALLWSLEGSDWLSLRAAEAIADPANELLVSAVSAYEICLKFRLGKLPGAAVLASAFEEEVAAAACTPLAISVQHAAVAGALPLSHKDPFDRLLIAQSMVERVPLVSNEALFDEFGIERLW